jgi:hypothetical protein
MLISDNKRQWKKKKTRLKINHNTTRRTVIRNISSSKCVAINRHKHKSSGKRFKHKNSGKSIKAAEKD